MARGFRTVAGAEVTPVGTRALPGGQAFVAPVDNSAAAVSSASAAAAGTAAGALMQASDNLGKIAIRTQTENNETAAKEADTQGNTVIRDTLFDPEKGYFTKQGKDAFESYKGTEEALRKAQADRAAAIANPEARKMYNEIATRRLDAALDSMAKHAALERRKWIDGVSLTRAMNASDDAIAYADDPAKREANLNVGRAEIITNGRDHAEDPEITNRKLREYDTKAYTGIIDRMMINDPIGAQKFYEANKHRIDGQQQPKIERTLKEATGRRTAETDADNVMSGGGDFATKVGGVENGGQYSGKPNASTNAGGRYGFTDGTFLAHARDADPEGTKGKSDADLLKLKNSDTPEGKALQDKAFTRLTRENEKVLKAADVPVNDTTRYLAHWFGAKGAVDIYKADPSAPISGQFKAGKGADGKERSPDDWAAENGVKGKTVGDVIALARRRMGDKTTALPGEGPAKTSTDPREVTRDIEANFSEYVDRARAIYKDDPERLDKALTIIRQRKAIAEEGYAAQLKVDTEKAWNIAVTADGTGARPTSQDAIPPALWTKLSPQTQEALTRQFAHNLKGTTQTTDQNVWYQVQRGLSSEDPKVRQEWAKKNLLEYRGQLSPSDFQELAKMQGAISKGDPDGHLTHVQTVIGMVNDTLRTLGIDPTPKENSSPNSDAAKAAKFHRVVQEQLNGLEAAQGKKASPEQAQQVIDAMTRKVVTAKGTFWDTEKRRFEVTIEDVPKEEKTKIIDALTRAGRPVSDAIIVDLFSRKNPKGEK